MKKLILFSVFVFSAVLLIPASPAKADGACGAKEGQYDAYCTSFDEGACEANYQLCDWYPGASGSGSCQADDAQYSAYCNSFDMTACSANTSLCTWIP